MPSNWHLFIWFPTPRAVFCHQLAALTATWKRKPTNDKKPNSDIIHSCYLYHFFLKLIGTGKVAKHTLDPLLVLWLVKLQPLQDLEENDSQRKIWDSSSPFLARLKWACICMHISWNLSQLWLWLCFHPEPPLHLPVPSSVGQQVQCTCRVRG